MSVFSVVHDVLDAEGIIIYPAQAITNTFE